MFTENPFKKEMQERLAVTRGVLTNTLVWKVVHILSQQLPKHYSVIVCDNQPARLRQLSAKLLIII